VKNRFAIVFYIGPLNIGVKVIVTLKPRYHS